MLFNLLCLFFSTMWIHSSKNIYVGIYKTTCEKKTLQITIHENIIAWFFSIRLNWRAKRKNNQITWAKLHESTFFLNDLLVKKGTSCIYQCHDSNPSLFIKEEDVDIVF